MDGYYYMEKLKDIKARKATLEDTKAVLDMAYDFYKEFMGMPTEYFLYEDIANHLATIIKTKDAEVFIAQNGSANPLGMVFVKLSPAYYNRHLEVVEEHHLYIKPEYRHSSVTKVLLQTIKEWAKNKGVPWIRAGITPDYKLKIKRSV